MSDKPNAWNINKVNTIDIEDKEKSYKPDERIKRIYEAKRKYARKARHEKFQRWLTEYTDKNIQIKEVLLHMCKEIERVVNESGFAITNEKRLRDEVATFIYKEASDYA